MKSPVILKTGFKTFLASRISRVKNLSLSDIYNQNILKYQLYFNLINRDMMSDFYKYLEIYGKFLCLFKAFYRNMYDIGWFIIIFSF